MTEIAGRQVARNDLGVMAAGAAALVLSFLPYVGVSYKIQGVGSASASINAWHGAALLGLLLVTAAAIVGTGLLLLRGLTHGGDVNAFGSSVSAGLRWGGYFLVLAGIVESVFAVMALRESGESVSFDRGATDTPPPAAT